MAGIGSGITGNHCDYDRRISANVYWGSGNYHIGIADMHESVEKIENIFGKRVCSCIGKHNHLPLNGRVIHKWIT